MSLESSGESVMACLGTLVDRVRRMVMQCHGDFRSEIANANTTHPAGVASPATASVAGVTSSPSALSVASAAGPVSGDVASTLASGDHAMQRGAARAPDR